MGFFLALELCEMPRFTEVVLGVNPSRNSNECASAAAALFLVVGAARGETDFAAPTRGVVALFLPLVAMVVT